MELPGEMTSGEVEAFGAVFDKDERDVTGVVVDVMLVVPEIVTHALVLGEDVLSGLIETDTV